MPRPTETELRRLMVDIGRLMYARGLIAGSDGNLSVRLKGGRILATPSGVAKGRMTPEKLVVTDTSGKVLIGREKPSSELKVHLAAYRLRPDIDAVVHAHPPAALALSLAGIEMEPPAIPEAVLTLGPIARTEYKAPGSQALAERMEKGLRCHNAMIMERHGALTLGRDLEEAYNRMESLEHTAQTLWMAKLLGPITPLPEKDRMELGRVAAEGGITHPATTDPSCRVEQPAREEEIRDLVREVFDRLSRKS